MTYTDKEVGSMDTLLFRNIKEMEPVLEDPITEGRYEEEDDACLTTVLEPEGNNLPFGREAETIYEVCDPNHIYCSHNRFTNDAFAI